MAALYVKDGQIYQTSIEVDFDGKMLSRRRSTPVLPIRIRARASLKLDKSFDRLIARR